MHAYIIFRASSEITLVECGTETEVVEEIQRDIQGLYTIFSEHIISTCDWLNVDNWICAGEILINEIFVEIVNPPTQCDSESESENDDTENAPDAVTTNTALSAIYHNNTRDKTQSIPQNTKHSSLHIYQNKLHSQTRRQPFQVALSFHDSTVY